MKGIWRGLSNQSRYNKPYRCYSILALMSYLRPQTEHRRYFIANHCRGMKNASALMILHHYCCNGHTAGRAAPTEVVGSLHATHVQHREQRPNAWQPQRDATDSLPTGLRLTAVYWQRRAVYFRTQKEWMAHVNYESPMNHLVFS